MAIVDAVHRHRVLSTEQIAALFFPSASSGPSSQCRTRLRLLVQSGYLHRAEQLQTKSDGRRPLLFMLTRAGCQLLMDELGYETEDIDWHPSYNNAQWPFLRHQLAINDAYVSFSQAAACARWRLEQWTDDRILRKRHVEHVSVSPHENSVAVVPDAYFSLVGSGGTPVLQFFLEIDRATMTVGGSSRRVKSWYDKMCAYQVYFTSGAIVERYGTRRIRVLTVTSSVERLVHLKEATEEAGGQRRYWFTTSSQLSSEEALLGAIWQVATADGAHPLLQEP